MKSLPGPRGLPLIGSLLPLGRDPLGFLTESARTYGDVVAFRAGPLRIVQLNHPDAIEEVLVQRHRSVIKDFGTRDLIPVLGQGLLTGEGDHWRRHRKLLAPLLQRAKIGRYVGAFASQAERLAAKADGRRELNHDFMALAFDVVMEALFADDSGGSDVQRVGADVETLMVELSETIQSWVRFVPSWVPVPGRRRVAAAIASLHSVAETLIERRRKARGQGDDLVSRLLDARDEHGNALTPEHVRDEALTMLLAGHETTALALTYAVWLLARHPAIQERLHAEVHSVLGGAAPTPETLEKLPYAQAVFREVLRLYPPAWAIGREVVEPFTTNAGIRMETGTQIFLSQWVVHRDPRWWPEPTRFRPERWLEPDDRPRFAWFPFGGGPRVCIGNHFAEMEGMTILAVLAQRLRFDPVDGEPPLELAPSVTLRPKRAVPVRVSRR
jgi:cytochrome P450